MAREGFIECPVCCEEIRARALLCRFCGAVLADKPLPQRRMSGAEASIETEREPLDGPEALPRSLEPEAPRTPRDADRLREFLLGSGEEYRTASVLFVDVCGYTALSEELSPEVVKDMLDSFYEICSRAVARYNGFIVKHAGDACLVAFGAPVAYDRDAEASVRTALEIREMMRLFPKVGGRPVRVSAGIATGDILSSVGDSRDRKEFDIFGSSVNLASRIESIAEPDQILICSTTHDLVEGVFTTRRLRARRFRNIAEPVATFEVLGERREDVWRRDHSVPFCGRERELERLETQWGAFLQTIQSDDAAAKPCGTTLSGMPGIGKSRLAAEFIARRSSAVLTLDSECTPHAQRVSYGLWRSLLRHLWNGAADDSTERTEQRMRGFVAELGEAGERLLADSENLPGLRAMFGSPGALEAARDLEPGVLRRQIQSDLRGLLEALAARMPVILLLDDLQWADKTSLEVLDSLAAQPPATGVFFLLVHRTGSQVPLKHLKSLPRLRVQELDAKAREALLLSLTPLGEMLPELREHLMQKSVGNPLFLVELVRTISERLKELGPEVRGRRLRDKIAEWVPRSLKSVLEARIDLLDKRRKTVLQCGAVLGRRFSFQIIDLFDIVRDGLLARLYSLRSLEYLDDLRTPSGLEFLFRQHLMRETAYQSLLDRQRRTFHRLIAERMETTYAARLDDFYPMLAYHFEQCDDNPRAIHYLVLAGERAADQGATAEAVEFYDAALERLLRGEPDSEARRRAGDILTRKGYLHRLMGQCDKALEAFQTAREQETLCEEPRERQLAVLDMESGLAYARTGAYASARASLAAARNAAVARGENAMLAMVETGLGQCAWGEGDLRRARRHFDLALERALEADDRRIEADARNNLAVLALKAGRLDAALENFRGVLALRHKAGDRFGVAAALMNQGIVEETLGRQVEAMAHYRESLALAERIHYLHVQCAACANMGSLYLAQERYAQAVECSDCSLELARQTDDASSEAIALENLALGHLGLLEAEVAQSHLRQARQIARKIGDAERLLSLDLVEIEILLAWQLPGGARRSSAHAERKLAEARRALEAGDFEAEKPRLLRLEARAAQIAGRSDEAREIIAKALDACQHQKNEIEKGRIEAIAALLSERANPQNTTDS